MQAENDRSVIAMGKPTGFLEYNRKDNKATEPLERIKNFNEFHTPASDKERKEIGRAHV